MKNFTCFCRKHLDDFLCKVYFQVFFKWILELKVFKIILQIICDFTSSIQGVLFFESLVCFYLGQGILTLDLRDCKWNMPFFAYCLSVLPYLSFCWSFFLLIYISESLVELFTCILLNHAKIEVIYAITCICYEDALEKVVTDRSYGLFLRSPLENHFSFGKWRKLSHQCKVTFDQISKSFAKRTTWNCIHEYFNNLHNSKTKST